MEWNKSVFRNLFQSIGYKWFIFIRLIEKKKRKCKATSIQNWNWDWVKEEECETTQNQKHQRKVRSQFQSQFQFQFSIIISMTPLKFQSNNKTKNFLSRNTKKQRAYFKHFAINKRVSSALEWIDWLQNKQRAPIKFKFIKL